MCISVGKGRTEFKYIKSHQLRQWPLIWCPPDWPQAPSQTLLAIDIFGGPFRRYSHLCCNKQMCSRQKRPCPSNYKIQGLGGGGGERGGKHIVISPPPPPPHPVELHTCTLSKCNQFCIPPFTWLSTGSAVVHFPCMCHLSINNIKLPGILLSF